MEKTNVDISYVLGASLLLKGVITYSDLCSVVRRIKNINDRYIINTDYENVINVIYEWRDFFYIDSFDTIKFTKEANIKRDITSLIFTSVLDDELYSDICKSIHYVDELKLKKLTIFDGGK